MLEILCQDIYLGWCVFKDPNNTLALLVNALLYHYEWKSQSQTSDVVNTFVQMRNALYNLLLGAAI